MARPNAGPIAVVSISNVLWADGALLDVVAIAEAARAAGALIAVDATQAVGAVPVDVRHIDPDFLMFPTYKWLLGPYGRAFLYVAKRHQNAIPLEQTASGRMDVNSESETYLSDTRYVENARRFDMGERDHFITMEMASVGMELIETVGVSAVFQHVEQLTHRVQSAFPKLIAGNAQSRSPHILSLNVGADRAKPICHALAQQNIHVSPRIGRVRVSPHIYNDDADIDRLIDALRPLVEAA
ncbi:MAG: aminotransferase class V-fold PLP-dependent enzyme, partial [Pseudomonadota bacterium]